MKRLVTFVLFLALGIAGCSNKSDSGPPSPVTQYTYADVKAQILGPSCTHCHSDGSKIPFTSYALVKASLDKINQMVLVQKAMPPKTPLADDKAALLASWIQGGAPEGTPETPPQVTPLEPTYASINAKLIATICAGCHGPQGPGKKYPMASLPDLLAAPNNLIVPGHPEESNLYLAVSAADTDPKKMPPPKSIMRPLTSDEQSVVKQWILNGASVE